MSASAWEPVIGLEIHVQLKTRTKMFCACESGPGGGENTQTCPVCLGHPGALPVPNGAAIERTIPTFRSPSAIGTVSVPPEQSGTSYWLIW